jgi:hypothetical protein
MDYFLTDIRKNNLVVEFIALQKLVYPYQAKSLKVRMDQSCKVELSVLDKYYLFSITYWPCQSSGG